MYLYLVKYTNLSIYVSIPNLSVTLLTSNKHYYYLGGYQHHKFAD